MTPVSLSKLEAAIIKPGLEDKLVPLTKYRGNLSLGRVHRVINTLVAGMEQNCSLPDLTQRLHCNPDLSHLCGAEKRLDNTGLYGFLSRLEDNPSVTNNIPHLLEYVKHLGGHRFRLTRLSEANIRAKNSRGGGARTPLVYPFLIHDAGREEHQLLRLVNAAIPKHYSPDLRADMCQDLIVGILCGDFSKDDLNLPAKEITKRVLKMFPTKYGPLSLDAEIAGTDGFTLLDTLSDDQNPWEMMEYM